MKHSKVLSAALAAALLLGAALPMPVAAWTQAPELSLSAKLSDDGKNVTVTLSSTASDPVCALQAELAYDAEKLTAVGKPVLASPWSGMLAAANVPVEGTAALAAASANDVKNAGGTVATMSFTVIDGATGSAYFYIRDSLIASSDGSRNEASNYSYITLDLSAGSSGSGTSNTPGAVPSSLLTPAERLKGTVILQDGNYAAVIEGALVHIDAQNKAVTPYINSDGRTMVPVRFIAEAFGAKVGWDAASRRITISYGSNTIVLTVSSSAYTINGKAQTMDTAPVISTGLDRTMVPIRFIMEALGKSVEWDAGNRLVIIAPADRPWDLSGSTESQATLLVLYLISAQMRDLV